MSLLPLSAPLNVLKLLLVGCNLQIDPTSPHSTRFGNPWEEFEMLEVFEWETYWGFSILLTLSESFPATVFLIPGSDKCPGCLK